MTDAQLTELLNHVTARALYAQIIKMLDMSNPTQLTEAELELLTFATIHIDGTLREVTDSWGVIDENYFYIDNKGFLVIIPKATFEQPTYEEIPVPEELPEDEEMQEDEEPDPCDTEYGGKCDTCPEGNGALFNHLVPQSIIDNLESREPNNVDNYFGVHDKDDGIGDINMDRYELNNASIPEMNSADDFFDYVRDNFLDLVEGDGIFDAWAVAYSADDYAAWNSNDPLGAIIAFHTPLDDMSVITSAYDPVNNYWVFTTVHTLDDLGHPVSGHRKFGVEDNGDGTFNFYTEGIDRLTGPMEWLANEFGNEDADFVFGEGAKVWKNLFSNLKKDIENNLNGTTGEFDSSDEAEYGDQYEYNENVDCE